MHRTSELTSSSTLQRSLRVLVFSFVFGACGGGGGDTPTPPPPPPSVATVELSSTSVDLAPNNTVQLRATARSSSGAELADRTVNWISSAPAVATVSAAGLVTGVTDGAATVTASVEGRSASANVTVRTPVAAVTVTAPSTQLTVGGTPLQLTATPVSSGGVALTGRSVAWSSGNTAVATVSASGLVTAVAPGTVVITATSENRTGSLSLSVVPPDPCTVVRTLALGQVYDGALAVADCKLSDNTAIQTFTFTLDAPAALEIEMTSGAIDPYLFVLDANRQVIAEDDDGGAGNNARVLRNFAAGRYYVVANTFNANSYGTYQLAVRNAPAACVTARSASVPTGVNAQLTAASSCRLGDESFADRYELNITARTTVRLDMSSPSIDPYLMLFDAAGRIVAQDDDAGPGLAARVEVQLDPGRYIALANAQPGQTGPYRFETAAAFEPCATTNRTLTIGQTVTGTLSSADCQTSAQGPTPFTQRWALNLATTSSLQIDMTSTAVDAYLILQNAGSGQIVAVNDDVSGTSTNSRIVGSFPAGQYIVNASTYAFNEVGPYSLSVNTIVPNQAINVTASPQSLALTPGSQGQITAQVSGTANTAVTFTSSATNIATVSSTGLVRAIAPGSVNINVRSQADPSRFTNVPVTIAEPVGGPPNLDIGGFYLVQSVQQLDGSVPLIANRDAVARVFLRSSRSGVGLVQLRVRLYQGGTLLTTLTASGTPSTNVDEGCCAALVPIPATYVRAGVSILVDVDQANAVTESSELDNSYPLDGTPQALNVITVPDFSVRFVPIRQNRSGLTGVASGTLHTILRSLWPLGTVNTSTRTALAIDYALGGQSFDEWGLMVRDLELVRRAESSNMYYYGLVRVNYTSGVLGLAGGIPALSAVGIDEGTPFGGLESRVTFAHEIGHTMGLRHAPCGGAAGPDPLYPFANAATGAFGMDVFGGNLLKLPTGTDIMSYCENQWVSVYNYRNVIALRNANPNGVPAGMIGSAATPVLLVSGGVTATGASIDGAFSVTAKPSRPDADGRFVVEALDASGRIVFAHRFNAFAVSDGRAGDEAFVVAVPVAEETMAKVATLRVREANGPRIASRSRAMANIAGAARAERVGMRMTRADGAARLAWSRDAAAMVLVRDARSGEIVGVGRSGALDLGSLRGADYELLVSDGVGSTRYRLDASTGAIRQ